MPTDYDMDVSTELLPLDRPMGRAERDAIKSALRGLAWDEYRMRHGLDKAKMDRVQLRGCPSLWSAISSISALAGRVSGAGLCWRFSNFRFGGAETGSTADRDWFAECLTPAAP
jgi:hypothetical protein